MSRPTVGWAPAPKPANIKDFNKYPFNAALANGPHLNAQRNPSKDLPASRGLLARGVNPVLGFIVISTLAWCSFQMLTESRAGDKKGRVFQHPMGESPPPPLPRPLLPRPSSLEA